MPDLNELVTMHGSIKRYRVEIVVEHNDGFVNKIAIAPQHSREGFSADDMHRELTKIANYIVVSDIDTDVLEKQARKKD